VALVAILVAIVAAGLALTPVQAFVAIAVLMLGFATVSGRGVTGLWRGAMIDDRNRISLSRLQLILWTMVTLGAFLTGVLTNIGNVGTAKPAGDRRPGSVVVDHRDLHDRARRVSADPEHQARRRAAA
jgi:hypothetical protein